MRLPCPCPCPSGMSDTAVRTLMAEPARGSSLVTWHGNVSATQGPEHWHVVEWRRCPERTPLGAVPGGVRCDLAAGHAEGEPEDGTLRHWSPDDGCHPPGPVRWTATTLAPVDDRASWPVPCWVTTAEEAAEAYRRFVMTPQRGKAEALAWFKEMEGKGLVEPCEFDVHLVRERADD